jgi:hypothetical protein
MTTEPAPVIGHHAPPPRRASSSRTKPASDALRRWMQGKISLRIGRSWLVGAAAVFLLMAMLAFD